MTVAQIKHLGITVTASRTAPTKAGKKPRDVWEVSGRVEGLEDELYGLGGKKWRGKFTFWADPTDDLMKLEESDRLTFASQQERKQELAVERSERLDERVRKHAAIASACRASADQAIERFADGQPILVGHHSEKSARAAQSRGHSCMRKSIDAANYSSHLADKVQAALDHADRVNNKEYVGNRIDECNKVLREIDRRLESMTEESRLERLNRSKEQARYYVENGSAVPEYVQAPIDYLMDPDCYTQSIAATLQEQADQQQKLKYWQQKMTQLGGVEFNKDTVKTGDWVRVSWGEWYRVYRSNAKTATLHYTSHTQPWSNPVKWASVLEHRSAADMEVAIADGQASYAGDLHKVKDIQ